MSVALPAARERSELARYWPAVLTCAMVAIFAWGLGFSGPSIYLAELHRTRGWNAALISSAITTHYVVGAICLTMVHGLFRRFGAASVLSAGVVLLGMGATLFSRAAQPWQMFAGAVAMGAGWSCSTSAAIATTLSRWFEAQRGTAISLALNGASAAGFTVAPVLALLSAAVGLGAAVPLVAAVGAAFVLALVWTALPRQAMPEDGHAGASETTKAGALLRSLHFWSVALPFALALAAQVGLIVHLTSILLPVLGPSRTAAAFALTSVAAMAGRIAVGLVIDRLHQRRAAAISFVSQAAGLAAMLLLPDRPAALFAGCALFGFSVGNVITFPALIVQREFPGRSFGAVVGLSTAVGQFAFAFAPALFGLLRAATGGYRATLVSCIVMQLLAALVVWRDARRPQSR